MNYFKKLQMTEKSYKKDNWKKTFAIIWGGQIFSTLSSMTVSYALIFWLSFETRSAEVLATATIASLLPQLILGPFIGVFIDRFDRRKIMISADLFIALCSVAIALLLFQGYHEIYLFYILMMLRSVGSAFHVPAMQASIPLLAPESELMRVSGVNQMIQSASIIAGPPLAALLIGMMDIEYVLLIDLVGAVFACGSLLLVHIPNPVKVGNIPEPHMFREMKEGLIEIYKRKGVMTLFAVSVGAIFFIMPIASLFPLMTINHFSGGTFQVSFIEVAWGAGTLAGGLMLGIKRFSINRIILINSMHVLLGLTFVFSGILPIEGFLIFVGLTFIGGISMALYSGTFMVVLQTTIEPAALGRVFSLYGSLSLLPSIVGLMYTGYLAGKIGIPNAFLLAGIALMLLGFYSFMAPSLRKMIKEGTS